jgi:hypothetical protein
MNWIEGALAVIGFVWAASTVVVSLLLTYALCWILYERRARRKAEAAEFKAYVADLVDEYPIIGGARR